MYTTQKTSPQKKFPFFRLARELRDDIYHYLWQDTRVLLPCNQSGVIVSYGYPKTYPRHLLPSDPALAWLNINDQLQVEALNQLVRKGRTIIDCEGPRSREFHDLWKLTYGPRYFRALSPFLRRIIPFNGTSPSTNHLPTAEMVLHRVKKLKVFIEAQWDVRHPSPQCFTAKSRSAYILMRCLQPFTRYCPYPHPSPYLQLSIQSSGIEHLSGQSLHNIEVLDMFLSFIPRDDLYIAPHLLDSIEIKYDIATLTRFLCPIPVLVKDATLGMRALTHRRGANRDVEIRAWKGLKAACYPVFGLPPFMQDVAWRWN